MLKRVLGISGKRFSGKDTLAAALVEVARERGMGLHTHAFAAESKRMFAERDASVDLERLLNDRAYKEAIRPRLTEFTVASINADPLVFCRRVADRIAAEAAASLITDVRLRLEVEHLRTRFELRLVRIVRPDDLRAASGWTYVASVDEHATECELDDPSRWDGVITNDGTVGALRDQAGALIDWLLG